MTRKIKEPKFRCGTAKAIESLSRKLALPLDKQSQDWSYEVAVPERLAEYLFLYSNLKDDDEKFVLIEIILEALNDQSQKNDFIFYWKQVKEILVKDFDLHEYTVYYWCCWDNRIEDSFVISKFLRKFWKEHENCIRQ